MILPIHVYGDAVLREETAPVPSPDDVRGLVADMLETMRGADGVGLAAPQVGRGERLFVVDLTPMLGRGSESADDYPPQPMVFVNPEITWESEEETGFEEGCLSIPDVREVVYRPERVRMTWTDLDGAAHDDTLAGLLARVAQHELDHLDGVLFTDHLSAFKRKMLGRRLRAISKGEVTADYPLAVD